MRRPPAMYNIRILLKKQLPRLPGRLGPQRHTACHTGTFAHMGPFCPYKAANRRPRRA